MLRKYLSREIEHWIKDGLLSAEQGAALMADHDRRHAGFSLSSVLAVLAAVLFGAAVIALVAANWDAIARPVRVGMIMVFILIGLGGAALSLRRQAAWVSEAMLVFAILCHGAGIALVGQMYHLSGDDAAFLFAWTAGALMVALCFSSATAAISAGLLGFGYLAAEASVFGSRAPDVLAFQGYWTVLIVAALIGVSAFRSRSRIAGHLSALMLLAWLMWIIDDATRMDPGYVLAGIGAVAFALGSFPPSAIAGHMTRHGSASTYGAVLLLSGLGLIQIDLVGPDLAGDIVMATLILVVSVAVLVISGKDNRMVRRFAYFAFACETVYVVGETLGTLLGSAGFLFFGGFVLAAVAYAVMRIEKRFKSGEGVS